MPLAKRILHDSDVYEQAYGELCEDTSTNQLIGNHNMSKLLGVLLEMSYLTAYSVEVINTTYTSIEHYFCVHIISYYIFSFLFSCFFSV